MKVLNLLTPYIWVIDPSKWRKRGFLMVVTFLVQGHKYVWGYILVGITNSWGHISGSKGLHSTWGRKGSNFDSHLLRFIWTAVEALGEAVKVFPATEPCKMGALPITRWWFQIIFIFTLNFGEDEPILTNIFQMGWFNHQLVLLFPLINVEAASQSSLLFGVCVVL